VGLQTKVNVGFELPPTQNPKTTTALIGGGFCILEL
jgi:hypothetical protein